jgi:hypothetical protein
MYSNDRRRAGPLVWIPFVVAGLPWVAAAQADGAMRDDSGEVQRITLEFTCHERFSNYVPVDLGSAEVVFKQEPTYSNGDVVRGFLPVGTEKEDHVAFALDVDDERLYVDSNRNFDLTDDLDSTYKSREMYWTEFKNVRVTLDTEAGSIPYALSVEYFMDDVHVSVCSGWQGECELGGRTWTFAVVDNLDGVIDGTDEFVMWHADKSELGGWPEHLRAASKLSVNRSTYEIVFAPEEDDWVATFTAVVVPMGILELTGEQIGRVILAGADAPTVLLDYPGSQAAIPAATYDHREVYVTGGEKGPFFFASTRGLLEVPENQTATFEAGGPLDNALDISRTGGWLAFDYRLVGIGGLEYEPVERDEEGGDFEEAPLPEVLISKDGKQISSGAFEYG